MARVMIVDDDMFVHRVLERVMQLGGHEVVGHANDGAEAVEKFVSLNPPPEVILMDHRMPVKSGLKATREILGFNPSVRILFVSADETVRNDAIDAGALAFLSKPVRSNQLLEAIGELLEMPTTANVS
jgi:two-component system chemotaxis response regulator CheY